MFTSSASEIECVTRAPGLSALAAVPGPRGAAFDSSAQCAPRLRQAHDDFSLPVLGLAGIDYPLPASNSLTLLVTLRHRKLAVGDTWASSLPRHQSRSKLSEATCSWRNAICD